MVAARLIMSANNRSFCILNTLFSRSSIASLTHCRLLHQNTQRSSHNVLRLASGVSQAPYRYQATSVVLPFSKRYNSTPSTPGQKPTTGSQGTVSDKAAADLKSAPGEAVSPTEKAIAKESAAAVTGAPETTKKLTIWEKVKHEAKHYWDGTKLLGLEVKISSRLLIKLLTGYELTRREFNQLKRTTSDMVRVVPFAMFIIIPFAELLLPIALKLFPDLLPSTYESTADKEKKLKRLRKTRKTVSDILIESVDKSGVKLPESFTKIQKQQFQDFFAKIRSQSVNPTRDELLNVARAFKDDMVLDNLSRPQLVAMASYINLKPFGTDQMLRYRIRYNMLQIKTDDKAIDYEGIESLSIPELQLACASRGIKTHGVSPARLRDDLQIWLNLRLRERVPSTLLLLSNAYTYGELSSVSNLYEALETVLSSIPEELIHEAQIDVAPRKEVTNKERLDVIKEQEELIKSEMQQEKDSGLIIQVKDTLKLDDEKAQEHEAKKEADATKEEKKQEKEDVKPKA